MLVTLKTYGEKYGCQTNCDFVDFFGLVFVSCAYGPRKDGRTNLEALNGANYETHSNVLGVPVVKRKPIIRNFAGHVYCGEGLSASPANHAEIALQSKKEYEL